AAGVSDVIVDLRFDGGGLLDVAEALADLLGGVPYGGQVMYSVAVNPNHSPAEAGFPTAVTFGSVSQSLPSLSHVAFLVTGASASASELVPNALEPYLAPSIPAGQTPRLALVGSSTYGKPVGQLGFTVSGCDQAILLIAFQLKNKDGEGSYFDGLPDAAGQFGGTTCQATDDLGHAMGDPAEAMTAQAISWLANGAAACTAIPARTAAVVTTGRAQARPAAEREPLGDPATPELPGVR
ncbi:MAG TPA: S41 family peptidase, partial [Anaeromyxobacter sp.]|nr:S41 family peptidase [Anaeromyxobacter sp.]